MSRTDHPKGQPAPSAPAPAPAPAPALVPAPVKPPANPFLFVPQPSQTGLAESLDRIPTYLFRLHAANTAGSTSVQEVVSPACHQNAGYRGDLLQQPAAEAAQRLHAHLMWHTRKADPKQLHPQERCNLMSWSSSLLFTLQFGFYRRAKDRPQPELADIHLLVLDTRGLPRGTFAQDVALLEALHAHSDGGLQQILAWRRGNKHFGEYFSQGRLRVAGRCRQTTMQQLIYGGLYNLQPRLNNHTLWTVWASAVVQLRQPFGSFVCGTDRRDVRLALTTAHTCLGKDVRWALPLAVMLLALLPREADHRDILRGFEALFTDEEIQSLNIGSMVFDPEAQRLPEVQMFGKMMQAIYEHTCGEDELHVGIQSLSIG